MTPARHIVALLRSHIDGDEDRCLSVAAQLAAHEPRRGGGKLAEELRELIDAAKGKGVTVGRRGAGPVPLVWRFCKIACSYSDIEGRLALRNMLKEKDDGNPDF